MQLDISSEYLFIEARRYAAAQQVDSVTNNLILLSLSLSLFLLYIPFHLRISWVGAIVLFPLSLSVSHDGSSHGLDDII